MACRAIRRSAGNLEKHPREACKLHVEAAGKCLLPVITCTCNVRASMSISSQLQSSCMSSHIHALLRRPKRHRGSPQQSSPQETARGQSPDRDSTCGGRCRPVPGSPAALSAGRDRPALPGAVGTLSPDSASQPAEGGCPASSRMRPTSSRKVDPLACVLPESVRAVHVTALPYIT